MTRRLILVVALLIIGAGAPPSPGPAPACMEDMACWNCAAMGNMACGPTSSNMSFDAR
jgi:hypothetical protein